MASGSSATPLLAPLALLFWCAPTHALSSAAATVPCKQCFRGGCNTWACALGQFCGQGRGECSGMLPPSSRSPAYGCNLASTPAAPAVVDCPQGFACCSSAGPFAVPQDNLTNYCRNVSAAQFCCGEGFGATPCGKNQRCCVSATVRPGWLQQQGCADVTEPPPPPPTPYPATPWAGPGSCCDDPATGNLSYVCEAGACCGTNPKGGIACINRDTQQVGT